MLLSTQLFHLQKVLANLGEHTQVQTWNRETASVFLNQVLMETLKIFDQSHLKPPYARFTQYNVYSLIRLIQITMHVLKLVDN